MQKMISLHTVTTHSFWLTADEDLDEDAIADYITEHFEGNSLIAAGDEDLVKIHFHTNEPWKILEYCNTVGEIYDIVVEDMIRQSAGMQGWLPARAHTKKIVEIINYLW